MKTITTTFEFTDGARAGVSAAFPQDASGGDLTWSGALARLRVVRPLDFYNDVIGEHFGYAMRRLAEGAGATVTITEEGQWETLER